MHSMARSISRRSEEALDTRAYVGAPSLGVRAAFTWRSFAANGAMSTTPSRRYTIATFMPSRHDRLELLDRYLRIPTISRQVTPEMIEAVRGLWRGLGLELTPLAAADGRGTPAFYGELPGPEGAPTLLLYGHYDVQPTGDVARWKWQGIQCEPFTPAYFLEGRAVEPRLIGDEALEDLVLVARGGDENQGQHLANILA